MFILGLIWLKTGKQLIIVNCDQLKKDEIEIRTINVEIIFPFEKHSVIRRLIRYKYINNNKCVIDCIQNRIGDKIKGSCSYGFSHSMHMVEVCEWLSHKSFKIKV